MGRGQHENGVTGGRLALLWDYWERRSVGGRLPARRDIDPVDLPRHLPMVMLIDGIGAPERSRYRFRLVGTGLTRLLVRDPTAKPLDQVLDDSEMDTLGSVFGHVTGQGLPAALSGWLDWSNGRSVAAEWLFLPLAADGRTVDMILSYVELAPLPPRLPAGRPRLTFSWMQPLRQCVHQDSGMVPSARGWLPRRETPGVTLSAL